ncbi:MAG: DNA repair protein RecN [Proteobacteria bacterium]|nr:DNA repair protein RecN [Pseudomonadota bacterium]
MLTHLSISNIVLIDRLELDFAPGLNVLTGETGAGKSILLDALALALGARSDAGLIRHGCDSASVAAEFSIDPEQSAINNLLNENGIEFDGALILRRNLSADGKSRAWINDVPVSVKTLGQIGDELVEIHGQFENHALLNPATHIGSLDEFATNCPPTASPTKVGSATPPKGGVIPESGLLPPWGESQSQVRKHAGEAVGGQTYKALLSNTSAAYSELHAAEKKLKDLREFLAKSAAEKDFLEHNVRELESLNPKEGEEEELSAIRAQMMDAEKNATILKDAAEALSGGGKGLDDAVFAAAHVLERIKTDPNPYQAQIDKLYDAGAIIADVTDKIAPMTVDTANLESTEERLFALRAAARKHRVPVAALPEKLKEMQDQLIALTESDVALGKVESEVKTKKSAFDKLAAELHRERVAASAALRREILKEFPDLKLVGADFEVQIETGAPSATGTDAVTFMIKTNPGTPFAPLHKIASGGELARLMLALRVVLSHGNTSRTFIFDEVDTGISGATASAVGERLSRLAGNVGGATLSQGRQSKAGLGQTGPTGQVIVVTHSAQVAGFGDRHFLIKKTITKDEKRKTKDDGATTITTVEEITGNPRLMEIARIISGAKITDKSIEVAKTLIKR